MPPSAKPLDPIFEGKAMLAQHLRYDHHVEREKIMRNLDLTEEELRLILNYNSWEEKNQKKASS